MSAEVLRLRARFARAAVVTDLEAVAIAFDRGARECREFAEAAPAWDPATLRRKLNAIVASTIEGVVNAETTSETVPVARPWIDPTDPRGVR